MGLKDRLVEIRPEEETEDSLTECVIETTTQVTNGVITIGECIILMFISSVIFQVTGSDMISNILYAITMIGLIGFTVYNGYKTIVFMVEYLDRFVFWKNSKKYDKEILSHENEKIE